MFVIRKISKEDRNAVIDMMRTFYASDAVSTNGSEEIFNADIDACIEGSPFSEGFVIEDNGETAGYVMIAKSFSTEFGKRCVWIEDIYVKEKFRGRGLGKSALKFILERYEDCVFRLEAEKENAVALKLYESLGFEELPYTELILK